MSALTQLSQLDLSAVTNARSQIGSAVNDPSLRALLQGGAIESALGALGPRLAQLRELVAQDPAALAEPLASLLSSTLASIDIDPSALDAYADAVRSGSALLADVVRSIAHPTELGAAFGGSLGDVVGGLGDVFRGYSAVGGPELARFQGLFETVQQGVPHDPAALADLSIELLLPFPRTQLVALRDASHGVVAGVRAIALPEGRADGLVALLGRLAAAARAGDGAAVAQKLALLAQTRANTLASVENDFLVALRKLGDVQLRAVSDGLQTLSPAFDRAEDGVLEIMNHLRSAIAEGQNHIEQLDVETLRRFIRAAVEFMDRGARSALLDPIDAFIRGIVELVRGLLDALPLRKLRSEVSALIHRAADETRKLELDRFARALSAELTELAQWLAETDLGAEVQHALASVESTVRAAIDAIAQALVAIGQAIEAVAEAAAPIVSQVAQTLAQLRDLVDEVKRSIAALPIEGASQQVLDSLRGLREKAEDLLRSADVPDAVRPAIDQLVGMLEQLNVGEALLGKVAEATRQFDLLAELGIADDLAAVQGVLGNLIPRELGAQIERELDTALRVFAGFDAERLRSAATGFVDDVAKRVDDYDLGPMVAVLHAPFGELLAVVDKLDPKTLLRPVTEEYRRLLGDLIPEPNALARQIGELFGGAAENLATGFRDMAAPLTSGGLASGTPGVSTTPTSEPPAPGGGTSGSGGGPVVDAVREARAGDMVRMLGFFPGKLREALHAIDQSAAGDVARRIDEVSGGLARTLRLVADEVAELEQRLDDAVDTLVTPVGAAMLDAHAALSEAVSGGLVIDGVDASDALASLALVSPGALRSDLLDENGSALLRVRDQRTMFGDSAASLALIADRLEASPLAALEGRLERLIDLLDVEPVAIALDALVDAASQKLPTLLTPLLAEITQGVSRFQAFMRELTPSALLLRFLRVAEVVREQLELLDPGRLADELAEIHAVIREAVAAYDPAAFVDELQGVLRGVGTALRSLDPAAWLRPEDLAALQTTIDRVEDAVPTEVLRDVGAQLAAGAEALSTIDLTGLVEDVAGLSTRVQTELTRAIEAVEAEIDALIASLHLLGGGASAGGQIGIGGGG